MPEPPVSEATPRPEAIDMLDDRSPRVALLEPRQATALVWGDERISYIELLTRVYAFSREMPVGETRVVIFSENSPAWIYGAYAIWARRGVMVPVDHLSTAEELAYVLNDCSPSLLLCSRHLYATAARALRATRSPPRLLVLEDLTLADPSAISDATANPVVDRPDRTHPNSDAQVSQAHRSDRPNTTQPEALFVSESQLAAIVYTSGTTGAPKGVMLSFGNLLANVRAVVKAGYFTPQARVLLLLPLHHVLPLAGSLVAPLFGGSTIVFATSMAGEELVATLQRHAITTIVGVPRFYDLLARALRGRIESSAVARCLFRLARSSRSPRFSRVIFGSVHRKFGGALRHLVCGGAALNPETAETFDVLGFTICEGYGMTECSPMITFPRLERIKLGSCGQVLEGCEARISDEGEILARGPNVMLGYYERPDETREILRDGWLHTGDLGHFDQDGFLYVTGRLKEIIVLSSGKKVSPSEVEASLEHAAGASVREAGVFLDGDVLHAIVVPNWSELDVDRAKAPDWMERKVIASYNTTVSPYRRISRLTLASSELPRTRLGKLRRHLLPEIAQRIKRLTSYVPASDDGANITLARLVAFFSRPSQEAARADSRLSADLGLDSLGRVELSVFVQQAFSVTISEPRLAQFETLRELAQFIDQCRGDAQQTHLPEAINHVSWTELLQPKNPPSLPRSSLYHVTIIHLSRILVRTLFRVRARGIERLPAEPFLLVPNHQSYLDGLFVCAHLPPQSVKRTLFYAKEQHVRSAWLRFLAERCNTIVMDPRQGFLKSLQQLAAGLRRGDNLILFPEGTRHRDGVLGPFKDSYAILARELHLPVVPVIIEGAHRVLPPGRTLPRFFGLVRITYLAPVRREPGEGIAEFNARVRSLIAEVLNPT